VIFVSNKPIKRSQEHGTHIARDASYHTLCDS